MVYKNMFAIIGLLVVAAGILLVINADVVMAISNATVSGGGPQARWAGNTTAGSNTTQGGNITAINIASYTLTNKWADYYGNVTGTIILGDTSGNVFSWAWSAASGGKVCVSTNSSLNFASAHNLTNGTAVDTAWGFTPTSADSANNTFNVANTTPSINVCNMSFAQANVTNTANVSLRSNFTTCLIGTNASIMAAGQTWLLAFCTAINSSGVNYKAAPSNFDIMVATNNTVGATETYYFYAELN